MWGENLQENPSVRRKNNDLIQKKTQTNPVMGVSIPKVRRDPMKHMKKKHQSSKPCFLGNQNLGLTSANTGT